MLILWRHALAKEFGTVGETVRWAVGHHMLRTPLGEFIDFWETLSGASHANGVPTLWFGESAKVSMIFRFGSLYLTTWDGPHAIHWQTQCNALEMGRRLSTIRSLGMRDEKFEPADKRLAGLPMKCTNLNAQSGPYRGAWSLLYQAGIVEGLARSVEDPYAHIAEHCPIEGMKKRNRRVKLLEP